MSEIPNRRTKFAHRPGDRLSQSWRAKTYSHYMAHQRIIEKLCLSMRPIEGISPGTYVTMRAGVQERYGARDEDLEDPYDLKSKFSLETSLTVGIRRTLLKERGEDDEGETPEGKESTVYFREFCSAIESELIKLHLGSWIGKEAQLLTMLCMKPFPCNSAGEPIRTTTVKSFLALVVSDENAAYLASRILSSGVGEKEIYEAVQKAGIQASQADLFGTFLTSRGLKRLQPFVHLYNWSKGKETASAAASWYPVAVKVAKTMRLEVSLYGGDIKGLVKAKEEILEMKGLMKALGGSGQKRGGGRKGGGGSRRVGGSEEEGVAYSSEKAKVEKDVPVKKDRSFEKRVDKHFSKLLSPGLREEVYFQGDIEDPDYDDDGAADQLYARAKELEARAANSKADSQPPPPPTIPGDVKWKPVTTADGKTYFFHPLTRETRWDNPDDVPTMPASLPRLQFPVIETDGEAAGQAPKKTRSQSSSPSSRKAANTSPAATTPNLEVKVSKEANREVMLKLDGATKVPGRLKEIIEKTSTSADVTGFLTIDSKGEVSWHKNGGDARAKGDPAFRVGELRDGFLMVSKVS